MTETANKAVTGTVERVEKAEKAEKAGTVESVDENEITLNDIFDEKAELIAQILSDGGYSKGEIYNDINCCNSILFQVSKKDMNVSLIAKLQCSINDIELEREAYFAKHLHEKYNIGPKLLDSYVFPVKYKNKDLFICILIMEKWSCSLEKYKRTNYHDYYIKNKHTSDFISNKIKDQIKILHQNGIVHLDIIDRNIFLMLKENEIIDATLGDMGTVQYIKDCSDTEEYFTLFNYHSLLNPVNMYKVTFSDVVREPRILDLTYFYCINYDEYMQTIATQQ